MKVRNNSDEPLVVGDQIVPPHTVGEVRSDVVFSLVHAARTRVEEEIKKDAERKAKKPRREAPHESEGGLSKLAKKDAAAKGLDFVGKTARKKQARA